MTDQKLLPWSGVLKNKVKRKSDRVSQRVFNGRTEQDKDYDNTFLELPDEVCDDITMKISGEFHKRVIDLSNENIRGLAAAIVGNCLETSPCEILNLSHNFIRCKDVELIIKHLSASTTNIKDLDFSNNRIGDKGAKFIAAMLQKNTTIERLNIDTNNIEQGIESIGRSLAKNTHLVSFSVSWNNLSIFAEEFYLAICNNKTLQTVSMGYCQLKDSCADCFATGLTSNATLKELILFGNQITDDGALKLSEALQANETLTYLNLDNNLLGDAGANALLEIIAQREKESIELTINVRQNKISPALSESFAIIRRRQARRHTQLDLTGGEIEDEEEADSFLGVYAKHNTMTEFFNNRFYEMNEEDEDPRNYHYHQH